MPEPNLNPVPPVLLRTSRSAKVWWVALGVVIFASGVVTGIGGSLLVEKRFLTQAIRHPDEMATRMAARMTERLQLSPEQSTQVQRILAQRLQTIHDIRESGRPKIEEQLNLMDKEVSAALNADQARQWHERFERFRDLLPPPPFHEHEEGVFNRFHHELPPFPPGGDHPGEGFGHHWPPFPPYDVTGERPPFPPPSDAMGEQFPFPPPSDATGEQPLFPPPQEATEEAP